MTAITLPTPTLTRLREHGKAVWLVPVDETLLDNPGNLRWMDDKDDPEVYGAGGVWLTLPRPHVPGDVLAVEGLGDVKVAEVRTPMQLYQAAWAWPVLLKLERGSP